MTPADALLPCATLPYQNSESQSVLNSIIIIIIIIIIITRHAQLSHGAAA
jgi:hypothetical protein